MEDIRVESISLKNCQCLPEVELRFGKAKPGSGQLIVLKAANAGGKTSFLTGVAALFEGGSDPSIIRNGAEKFEGILKFSNSVTAYRTQTFKGSYLRIETEDGLQVKSPQAYIEKMAKSFAFDPVKFDRASKKEQIEWLLKVMPIAFSADEITKAIGTAAALVSPPAGALDIVTLDKFVKELTEKRAATGNRRDEKSSTVEQLRKSLAASDSGDTPRDWKAELALLQANRDAIDEEERKEILSVAAEANAKRKELSADIRRTDDEATRCFAGMLESARTNAVEDFDATLLVQDLNELSAFSGTMKQVDGAENEAISAIRDRAAKAREAMAIAITAAQAGSDAQIQTATIRTSMEDFQRQCRALNAEYDSIDKAVKELAKLRASKLDTLPVSGLEIRDGGLYVDGVPWSRLNQAARWIKSIEIGCQGIGNLAFFVCDEAEHLDSENWEVFQQAVIESGAQVIAARVPSPEELKIHGGQLRSEPAEALSLAS